MSTDEWSVLDRALMELAQNRDLEEKTAHEYIVGYLCKAVIERKAGLSGAPRLDERERRSALLQRTRAAVRSANPETRDLVQELIEERREEGRRG